MNKIFTIFIAGLSFIIICGCTKKESKETEVVKPTDKSQLGTYPAKRSESNYGFSATVKEAFNFDEFYKLFENHIKEKTPYESDEEYRSKMLKSIEAFNKESVQSYIAKNPTPKYIYLKLDGIKDYSVNYDANKQLAQFNIHLDVLDRYDVLPKYVYLYGNPIIAKEEGLAFGKLLTEGIQLDKNTAIQYNIAYNPGHLLIKFKLDIKNGEPDPDKKYVYRLSEDLALPALQVVRCEWIVNDKIIRTWEGEGEYSGNNEFSTTYKLLEKK